MAKRKLPPDNGKALAFACVNVQLHNAEWEEIGGKPEVFTDVVQLQRFVERWFDYRSAYIQGNPDAEQAALAHVHALTFWISMETAQSIEVQTAGAVGGN